MKPLLDIPYRLQEIRGIPLRPGLLICCRCGCADIAMPLWINANTHTHTSIDTSTDQIYWCPRCDDRVDAITVGNDRLDEGMHPIPEPWVAVGSPLLKGKP